MNKPIRWLCIMCVLILPSIIPAQEWVARYNGPGSYPQDYAYAIALDNTGNIYVTGASNGSGTEKDYATVKYNSLGVEQWVARYDGLANGDDEATAIALDNTGNIYVTGWSNGSGTEWDYATVKYDASGIEQWVARYNGPGNEGDEANAIAVDNLGNIYVTGGSYGSGTGGDYVTLKYDSSGVEQWVAVYNGPGNGGDVAYAIAVDSAGYIYVTGRSEGFFATVKYNTLGVEQWVARYDYNYAGYASAIVLDSAGNIYVTGGWIDYVTLKYDSLGVEQWVAIYNGPGNANDYACAIGLDNAGNIYITGSSCGLGTELDYVTVKYNSMGVEQWVARYNGPSNYIDEAAAIAIDNAANIYVTGYSNGSGTYADYATVKYDTLGMEQWVVRYNGPGNGTDRANAIAIGSAANIYVTGYSQGLATLQDYATMKYLPIGIEESQIRQVKTSFLHATIFCGPLQLPESNKCKVFDITGGVVQPDRTQPGIYFIEVDGVVIQKVVKVR